MPLFVPGPRGGHRRLQGPQSVGRIGLGRLGRAEGRHDAIAQELIDAAPLLDDDRDHVALIGRQEAHRLVRVGLGGIGGEAAHVEIEDRGLAGLSDAGVDRAVGALDLRRHLGREKPGELLRGRLLGNRADQQALGTRQGDRDDDRHQEDR